MLGPAIPMGEAVKVVANLRLESAVREVNPAIKRRVTFI